MWRTPQNQTSIATRDALTTLPPPRKDDKRPYIFGLAGGLTAGLLGAFFFKRASEENPTGQPKISTMQMLGLATSVVGLLRQIAELGKPPQKK